MPSPSVAESATERAPPVTVTVRTRFVHLHERPDSSGFDAKDGDPTCRSEMWAIVTTREG
jgi:hypothetical protein